MRNFARFALLLVCTLVLSPRPAGAAPGPADVPFHGRGLALDPFALAASDTAGLSRASLVAPSVAYPPFHKPDIPPVRPARGGPGELRPVQVPALCGLVASFVCAGIGTYVGMSGHDFDEGEVPGGAVLGYLIGEVFGMAGGVHLGNGKRGDFGSDVTASSLGQAGAVGLAGVTHSAAAYALGCIGQLAWTVANERREAGSDSTAVAPHHPGEPESTPTRSKSGRSPVGDRHTHR